MSATAAGPAIPATIDPQRLERLLRYARLLSRSAFCAAPVRALFEELAVLQHALVDLPERLLKASDHAVAGLLRRYGDELDRALYGSPWQAIEELFGVAVADDPRLAGLEQALPPHLELQRQLAREALRRRGIERIAPSPGCLLDSREVVPADRPSLPTGQAHLHGRVAGVQPGDAGWRLHGTVVRPAQADVYGASVAADGQAAG